MALTIEGASVGYDANNIQTALNNVHNNCVEHTKTTLRNNLSNLNDAINACWVGQSAETFKDNMQHDVDVICDCLDKAYEGLVNAFKAGEAGLAEVDQTLVTPRG